MSNHERYPLFVDMHVHFRDPSANDAETIETGSYAALTGGYGYVFDMPNNPKHETWTLGRVLEKHDIAYATSRVRMGFYAGWQPDSGVNPNELRRMAPHVIGMKRYITKTTGNDRLWTPRDFREADLIFHEDAPEKPILIHPDNIDQVEEYIKDFAIPYNHHVHVCHVNDPEVGYLVKEYQHNGAPVSSGVTGHHLTKTSHDRHTHGKFAEMMPDLADQHDAEQLLWQLNEGIIDVVETDHAPHSKEAKIHAEHTGGDCFGVPGIEKTFSILRYQVERGRLSKDRLVDAMSTRPAKIMGIKISDHSYSEWDPVTYRIEDEEKEVTSGSGWTPYLGNMATGRLVRLVMDGHDLYDHNEPNGDVALNELGISPVITNRMAA